MNERIRIAIEDGIAYVRLNRPEKHNGVDFPMLRAMLRAQRSLKRRRDIRAVILQGEGPSFCAGLDFKSVLARPLSAGWMALQLWLPWRNLFQRWSVGWRDVGVPVIAVVHGNCFGAGFQLALGRSASAVERTAAQGFLEVQIQARQQRDQQASTAEVRRRALADLCQALFSLNEFIYID